MGTHYQGSEQAERALNAYINLMRAAETLSARVQQQLSQHGLTETQFGVLEVLHHLGPLCQRALGDKLLKSGGNITLVIDNLEKQGLVERQRSPEDRRYVNVHLTPAGQQLIADIFPGHAELVTGLMSPLRDSEQELLRHFCRWVGKQTRCDARN